MVSINKDGRILRIARSISGIVVIATATLGHAETPARLVTECSKQEIFFGQTVSCNFVIVAEDDALEIEVVKFPEFRGFWSENTALKQGPINLFTDPRSPTTKRSMIGSYIIAPMLSDTQPAIEPMNIVVRRPLSFNAEAEQTLLSEPPPLAIHRLPPTPPEMQASFGGAVGQFQFASEFTETVFSQEVPITLRFFLRGEGNFHEIPEPPLELPPEVEKLDARSWLQGTPQFPSKIFEYSLQVRGTQNITLPPVEFSYFDPTTRKFEKIRTSPIQLRYVASQLPNAPSEMNLPAVIADPQIVLPIEKRPIFWVFNGLCALAFIALLWRKRIPQTKNARVPTAEKEADRLASILALNARVQTAQTQADAPRFFSLVLETIREIQKMEPAPPRSEDIVMALGSLRSTAERFLYSPDKPPAADMTGTATALNTIVERLKPSLRP